MEEEYKSRYGDFACTIVTDGIEATAPEKPLAEGPKSIYFMGLMHQSYAPNFEALARAVAHMNAGGDSAWRAMIRCGRSSLPGISNSEALDLLPFSDERQVESDLQNAGVVYLPLPFDRAYADFVRFSLSTKLITYLASGVPILYHGPQCSAAYQLLSRYRAAEAVFSLDPVDVAKAIRMAYRNSADLTTAARNLAREKFLLKDQRERFWVAVPVPNGS